MTNPQTGGTNAADAEIATIIRGILEDKGMSILALSELAGIAYPTLRRSLKGGRSLTFREFGTIADALEIATYDLLPNSLTAAA